MNTQITKDRLDPRLAACASDGVDPDMFFADDPDYDGYSEAQTALAKVICSTCELRQECLEVAMVEQIPDGVWGGLTGKERRMALNRTRIGVSVFTKRERVVSPAAVEARNKANELKTVKASERDREMLTLALKQFDDIDPLTVQMALLRINNPGLTLAQVSGMMVPPVSKDVFAGRLKRLVRRIDERVF